MAGIGLTAAARQAPKHTANSGEHAASLKFDKSTRRLELCHRDLLEPAVIAKRKKPAADPMAPHEPRKALFITTDMADTPDQAGERVGAQVAAPELAAWRVIAAAEGNTQRGAVIDTPGMLAALRAHGAAINAGDMNRVEAMLMGQATALQSLFARLIERGVAQDSLQQYEAHMRLALKAQAQSRA